tara:strand:+ start:96 stop:539 length:444 start_codon:yes stop_codon:yes gene_type:complete
MINSIIINNIEGEYVPKDAFFQDWLKAVDYKKNSEITIKIVTEDEMREFNKLYKGEDKISDTLAFPFEKLNLGNKIILGDIAMCAKKINNDASVYKKNKIDRWAHLTIHSVLHILGYLHDNEANQKKMEKMEIDILRKFNILNPYEI